MTKTKEIYKTLQTGLPLVLLPMLAYIWGRPQPGWVLMWLLAFSLFAACKILTGRQIPEEIESGDKWTYFLGWPGMDPKRFFARRPQGEFSMELGRIALRNVLLGAGLMLGVAPRFFARPLLAGWIGMTGLIFMLHFGLFHLLALHLQRKGFGADPIMNRPHLGNSLANFWGQRWNRAFQCLTWTYLFQPLRKRMPAVGALWICFLVSGLIHELVITVPARGGYGGPTAYFLLQALGLVLERKFRNRVRPWLMRVWTLSIVLLPAGWLFPAQFVLRIIVPMFQAWGIFPPQ